MFKDRTFVCSCTDLSGSLCKLCPVEKVLQKMWRCRLELHFIVF